MAFDSFRDFVNALNRAGELKRIAQPVAINTMGSHKRMAMSLGAESVDEVANKLGMRGPHKRAIIRTDSFSRRVEEKPRQTQGAEMSMQNVHAQ
jgi:3-polyprenyl-4-hydroxybenzoate decarboxylase